MTANEIRKKFLDFFASKRHTIVESDTLVPKDDPTVLFTTAGMQQFKRQFLGRIDPAIGRKAASSQKCLRTDDLEKVGKTPYHHTFFEMLGNFSFGDYFKEEAIEWAWEFLTKELKIPAEKLWVSVYQEDEEAHQIWRENIKVPSRRIIKLGDKSNFWPSEAKAKGPNGPCGPCSEIFYDYGINPKCPKGKDCNPDCSCGRFTEVWNLVFTQFNRKDGGILEPLPAKNIDTGMGFERLTAVVQGKKSNYATDLFTPIIKAIEKEIEQGRFTLELQEKFIIADHIRAIVFAIHDGVIPSNKERGSVIKRLIHDATNLVMSKGLNEPSIYKLVPVVMKIMQSPYPELQKDSKTISQLVQKTEEAFLFIRSQRIPEFEEKIREIRGSGKSYDERAVTERIGQELFIYRDTYGLPFPTMIETIRKILPVHEQETTIPKAISFYGGQMAEQQKRSRATSKMSGDVFTEPPKVFNISKTEFVGYTEFKNKGKILRLVKDNTEVEKVKKSDSVKVILDRTPFYAEAGGQIGDSGFITGPQGKIRVKDTQKSDDIYFHIGEVEEGHLQVHEEIMAEIDQDRRLSIMRNHTATHILQAALRSALGSHVQQQGSLVAEDRLRFDFTHPQPLTEQEKQQIEDYVNSRILCGDRVEKQDMPLEEARKSGALAFFAEKYGRRVRVVSINGYSKEFCAGTHLDSTGQIGFLKIINESAIAQGIRRIEAKTGLGALSFVNQQTQQISEIAKLLKSSPEDVVDRIEKQNMRVKQLEKELAKYQLESIRLKLDPILDKSLIIRDTRLISHVFDNLEMEILRNISDLIKQKVESSVILLGSRCDENAYILLSVSDNLVKSGIKADSLIKRIAPLIEGNGGGRPQMAQAGSKQPAKVEQAIKQGIVFIKEQLGALKSS